MNSPPDREFRLLSAAFRPSAANVDKIERRLFSPIAENWRGRPLVSQGVVINLIASTTTRTALKIRAKLDVGTNPTRDQGLRPRTGRWRPQDS